MLFVSPTTPALVAAYAASPGPVTIASVDAMFTIRPASEASRWGSANRTSRAWAVRLMSSVVAQFGLELRVVLVEERVRQRDAGVVDHGVDAPERRHRRFDQRRQLRRVGHVAHHADHTPGTVDRADLVDDGPNALNAEIGDAHLGALVGEKVSSRPAHAARGSGDDHGPSGHRP